MSTNTLQNDIQNMLLKTSRNLSRRTTSRGFSSLADSLNSSLAETDPDLLAIINDEKQRQKESINLIGKKHILCFCIVVLFLLVLMNLPNKNVKNLTVIFVFNSHFVILSIADWNNSFGLFFFLFVSFVFPE